MMGLGRAYVIDVMPGDAPRTVARVGLIGPRGGYIGDTGLDRADAERLRNRLDTLLAEDAAGLLAAQHTELGVKP